MVKLDFLERLSSDPQVAEMLNRKYEKLKLYAEQCDKVIRALQLTAETRERLKGKTHRG